MGARPAATALPSRDAVRTRRRERELRAAAILVGGGAAHLTLGWVLALNLAPDQPWALVVGPFLTLGGFIAAGQALAIAMFLTLPATLVRRVGRNAWRDDSADEARTEARLRAFYVGAHALLTAVAGALLGAFPGGAGVLLATGVGGAIGWTSGMLTRQAVWRAGAA